MQTSVQVTFRDMPVSDALEARCWEEAAKLERDFDGIIGCHVTIARWHHRLEQETRFEIHIGLSVPGRQLVVNREPDVDRADGDVDAALREAFDRLRSQLRAYAIERGHEATNRPLEADRHS